MMIWNMGVMMTMMMEKKWTLVDVAAVVAPVVAVAELVVVV
jgi:hypothetical protein